MVELFFTYYVSTRPDGQLGTKVQSLCDYKTPQAGPVINAHQVEAVDRFCYLGGTISSDCRTDSDTYLRIGRAAAAMASLDNICRPAERADAHHMVPSQRDQLKDDLLAVGLNLNTAWEAARDRSTWRTICRGPTLPLGACGLE
ncbi:Hypp583 [Branchiostoma lanceolatum]|uniref:Hypp583 protein n=1 Tax=Branchiostoma lanceolatum TaxID=7740 RepID=A0A8J9VAW1_BRALA|nr:Hypp583 [Branchiostoma lanceolatum]